MSETNKEKVTLEQNELNEVSGGATAYSDPGMPTYKMGERVRCYSYFVGHITDIYLQHLTYGPWVYDVSNDDSTQRGVLETDMKRC